MSESTQKKNHSLCFVAFDAVSLIFPDALGSIGGAETQVLLMARALSMAPEVRVVVVVRDSRSRPVQVVDGFTVVTKVDRLFRIRRFVSEHVTVLTSFPWIRIRSWHPNLLWQIPFLFVARLFGNTSAASEDFDWLAGAFDCDVFCCTGTSERTAQVFEAVRKHHHKTILFIVSDADLDERYLDDPELVNKHGDTGKRCADAIRCADIIACQTDLQQKLLAERFARESVSFPNPFDHDDWLQKSKHPTAGPQETPQFPSRFAFWIGRSDRHHKRPELLLRVAENCPDVCFVMVMNTHDETVAAQIRENCPSNVWLIDRIPFAEIPRYFRSSAMFISTGSKEYEGFPNVFLQAAATGVPIVSLEADPGFISDFRAGIVCHGNLNQLITAVKSLWQDTDRAKDLGRNGQDYVISHHSAADARKRLLEILDSVG